MVRNNPDRPLPALVAIFAVLGALFLIVAFLTPEATAEEEQATVERESVIDEQE